MRKVSVLILEPGMKLGQTVYSSIGEVMLEKGITFSSKLIKKLIKTGIPFVYIDDALLTDYLLEDVISLETRLAASQQVKNILLQTQESGRLVIEPTTVYNTVKGFTDSLLAKRALIVNLVDLRTQDDYTFAHSVNVCVLALMTGITLGYSREQLASLGVGALLHDLGKVNITNAILNKPDALTLEEFAIMKKHTIYGYELIKASKNLAEEQALIALQHHECYDGSGYPHGLSGDAFTEFAQVVAIADKFDALTANRIYRRAFPPHEAYEMCAASGNYLFKDKIVKAFLYNIAAYPAGSVVELNSGQIGVVMDTPQGYSIFPRVRVLFENGNPLSNPKEISLAKQERLFVVKVLDNNDVAKLIKKIKIR